MMTYHLIDRFDSFLRARKIKLVNSVNLSCRDILLCFPFLEFRIISFRYSVGSSFLMIFWKSPVNWITIHGNESEEEDGSDNAYDSPHPSGVGMEPSGSGFGEHGGVSKTGRNPM